MVFVLISCSFEDQYAVCDVLKHSSVKFIVYVCGFNTLSLYLSVEIAN